jgi:hypothetical protein
MFQRASRLPSLPTELWLRIVEEVLESDPKAVKSVKSTSKRFNFLMKVYERSIVKRIVPEDHSHDQLIVQSRTYPEFCGFIRPLSYRWLHELHFRVEIMDSLTTVGMIDDPIYSLSLTTRPDFEARAKMFKITSLRLLYELVDSTCSMKSRSTCQETQCEVLSTFNAVSLIPFFGSIKSYHNNLIW